MNYTIQFVRNSILHTQHRFPSPMSFLSCMPPIFAFSSGGTVRSVRPVQSDRTASPSPNMSHASQPPHKNNKTMADWFVMSYGRRVQPTTSFESPTKKKRTPPRTISSTTLKSAQWSSFNSTQDTTLGKSPFLS